MKIVKWIRARSTDEAETAQSTAYISEESDPESHPAEPHDVDNNSESGESENDSDEELFSANQNKFSALLPDD